MNRKALLVIGLVIVAGTAILLWRAATQQNQFSAKITAAQQSNVGSQATSAQVELVQYAFSPDVIKVKIGTKVTWTNQDNALHTIESADGKFQNSHVLKQGGSYETTFNTPGIFRYHCGPHPDMLGAVIVTE